MKMYAITGITGKVGGALARALLADGQPVRAVVRDADKGRAWAERGCAVALAEMQDAASLSAAFKGAEGVFILPPSEFDPLPGFPEARAVIDAVKSALESTSPDKVVCLSTIGAQASQPNLLTQRTLMEQALGKLPMPIAFLRPGWFMENAAWDIDSAKSGLIQSYLQPLDRAVPMVSSDDVGRAAAALLQERWEDKRVVELEGPQRVSPNALAAAFAKALGTPVRAEVVPRAQWESIFRAQGMKNPTPRIQMIDGFNAGWIDFADRGARVRKGSISIDQAITTLIQKQRA
jgi:NAD(P)H dehydrogenase (quinone)